MADLTLKLRKPIQAHGSEVSVLTFREPDGKDIMECGYPTTLKSDGGKKFEIAVDAAATGKLIAVLANIPPSSVEKMNFQDFQAAGAVIAGFFKDSIAGLS